MNYYFDSFDCQIQCEDYYLHNPEEEETNEDEYYDWCAYCYEYGND